MGGATGRGNGNAKLYGRTGFVGAFRIQVISAGPKKKRTQG